MTALSCHFPPTGWAAWLLSAPGGGGLLTERWGIKGDNSPELFRYNPKEV